MFKIHGFPSVSPDAVATCLHWLLFVASALLIRSVYRLHKRVEAVERLAGRTAATVDFPEGRPEDGEGGIVLAGHVDMPPAPAAGCVDPDEIVNRYRERRAPGRLFFRGGVGQ